MDIGDILAVKLKIFLKSVFSREPKQVLKSSVTAVILSAFAIGSYFFFRRIFFYLGQVQDIGMLLMDRAMAIGFMVFLFMLVVSNLVTSISTLYRSKEVAFLLSTPLSWRGVFTVKFMDNLFYSSWAILLIGIPVIASYGYMRGLGLSYYLYVFFLGLVPFVVIPACLGVSLSFAFIGLSKRFGARTVVATAIVVIVISAAAFLKFTGASRIIISVGQDYRALGYYLGQLAVASSPFLPSFWFTEVLKSAANREVAGSLIYCLALITTAMLFYRTISWGAGRVYYPSWLALSELRTRSKRRRNLNRGVHNTFLSGVLLKIFPRDVLAVLVKDNKLFIRDPGQWAQFSILLILLFIYLFNLKNLPMRFQGESWRTVISFLNFGFSGYILATLCVRFVFPSISLEGQSFWIIGSSPMSLKRFFWEKFCSAFFVFFLLAEAQAVISSYMLDLSGMMMALTFSGILVMSVSLTCLSVGMGAIYPSFEETDPGKIASTAGGAIDIIFSLLYVAAMVVIVALPTHRYTLYLMKGGRFPKAEILIALVAIAILNLVVSALPIRYGIRSLMNRDF